VTGAGEARVLVGCQVGSHRNPTFAFSSANFKTKIYNSKDKMYYKCDLGGSCW
jgi:hypothetical protein